MDSATDEAYEGVTMPESSDIARNDKADASKHKNSGHVTCFKEKWKEGCPWLCCEGEFLPCQTDTL
ncbi:hypothetical protein DPMN_111099 [Dreissena polymorpha]|uniref:Uncharacterized protein n=1 Tax=Dreissena polymorpha TaxID=45954 RepID=A0A9D4KD98_DREPO|nr:hypothetical protein DPMN_111099 [Dreissena polymorpha]